MSQPILQLQESEVKPDSPVRPHFLLKPEPGSLKRMAVGREPDDALNWYCHMRIAALIDSGMSGTAIAEETGLAESAVSTAKNKAIGIGSATAKKLVKLFGFNSRGELVDAADAWWLKEGHNYSKRHHDQQMARFRAKMLSDAARSTAQGVVDANRGRGVHAGRAAMKSKAQKLLKGSGSGSKRSAGE